MQRDGIPIAMGYFAVTFSLGIIAARAGLSAPLGFLSSFFTRASAGEYGTYTLVAVQAAYVEVIAMCLVANLRYMLMSAALSQKIAPDIYIVLGIGVCCGHRGRLSVAPADGDSPEYVALRHVPGQCRHQPDSCHPNGFHQGAYHKPLRDHKLFGENYTYFLLIPFH